MHNHRRRNMMGTTAGKKPILYLPLSYDGDLTERVSGSSNWVAGVNNYMTWDANEKAYKFLAMKDWPARITGLALPAAWADRATTKRICECDIKATQFSNNGRICLFGMMDGGTAGDNYVFEYDVGSTTSGGNGLVPLNRWVNIIIVQDGLNVKYYTDGTLTGQVVHVGNTSVLTNNLIIAGAKWRADEYSIAYLKNIKIYEL